MNINALLRKVAATAAVSAVLTGGAVFTCGSASASGWDALDVVINEFRPLAGQILSEGSHIPVSPTEAESLVTRTRGILSSTVRSDDDNDRWTRYWRSGCKVNKQVHRGFKVEQVLQEYQLFGYDRERVFDMHQSLEQIWYGGKKGSSVANSICKKVFGY
ncbi:hypothetical protein AWC29_08145 [Mycobacterium triplex]|uniref:Lipoprotein n=1 Tax=Mycobacterium triplex TaxID=47839 RepID=A0A024JQI8_9MYCO|nr:hypothetical protein [Mycobacterium triplex]ORX06765.1 hypothetical protein AWC29_08145 [Mycobacterium triplex]CDO85886.1 hypothetical protein BN973_00220 [Mycobacterium triplex]